MQLLRDTIRSLRWSFIWATTTGALKAGLSVLVIAAISRLIQTEKSPAEFAYLFGLITIALGVGILASLSMVNLYTRVAHQLRHALATKVLRAGFADIERTGLVKMKVILTTDINTVSTAFSSLPDLVFNAFFVILSFTLLAYLDLTLFGIFFLVVAVSVVVVSMLVKAMRKHLEQLRTEQDNFQENVEMVTLGMKEMALNKARRAFFHRSLLLPTINRHRDSERRGDSYGYVAANWAEFAVLTSLAVLILVAQTIHKTPISVLANFILVLVFLRGPMASMIATMPIFGKARIAFNRMREVLNFDEVSSVEFSPTPAPVDSPRLVVEDLYFSYLNKNGDYAFSVGPMSMKMRGGEIIFVVGGNGSGKSTFLKLISGLYIPSSGRVTLDGIESTDEQFRDQFSAIFSDYFLMPHVIDESGESVAAEDGDAVLKRLHLLDKVRLDGGRLSDTNLSQGQKKRLALLVSYFENKRVVVFDEWAADQDPYFKELFYREILQQLKDAGKLVIVVSHDERYFEIADRILKLTEGHLTELPTETIGADIVDREFAPAYI